MVDTIVLFPSCTHGAIYHPVSFRALVGDFLLSDTIAGRLPRDQMCSLLLVLQQAWSADRGEERKRGEAGNSNDVRQVA